MTRDSGALAAYFDRCAGEGAMSGFAPEEEPEVERLLALWDLKPGERVVEPGCGTGRLTERLARAVGPEGHVLAFDISRGMLARAAGRGLPGHVTLAVADALAIPADDAGFDAAICFQVFPHFADPARALSELARVLAPDGRLWVNHLRGREELNEFHRTVAHEVSGHELPDEAAMRRLVSTAGFDVRLVEDGAGGYSLLAVRPQAPRGRRPG